MCAGKSIEVHPSGTSLVGEDAVIMDCNAGSRSGPVPEIHLLPMQVTTGITNGIMTEILGGIDRRDGNRYRHRIRHAFQRMKPASGERSPFMPGPPGENKDKNGKRADDGKQESDRARDIRRNFQVGTKPSMPLGEFRSLLKKGNSSPSWVLPVRESPHCSTFSAVWIHPLRENTFWTGFP